MTLLKPLLTLLLITFVTAHPTDIRFREGDGSAQICPESSTCELMTKCPIAFSSGDRTKFPPICKWDNSDPWVCCPTPEKLINPALTEFPENECAAGPEVIPPPDGRQSFSVPLSQKTRNLFRNLVKIAVVGGEDVKNINSYPFVAAIYQTAGTEKVFLCGGTLLSKNVILTAAHCFLAKDDSSKYMVQLGSANFGTSVNTTDLKVFQVSSVKVHEEFKYPKLYNDIALVKFQGLESFSEATRPVCLLDKAQDDAAKPEVTVLGWGSKQLGGSLSSILQEAKIQTISNPECNSTFARLGALGVSFPEGIVNKIVCAGGPNNEIKDACQGDSGGPLVALVNGKWRQRGIVSGGIGCGIPGNPGIYTRVAEYITWIKTNAFN